MFSTLWIGKNLPDFQRMCLSSFISNNFEISIYCYDNVDNLPDGIVIKDANQIINESEIFIKNTRFGQSISQFSDIFRYTMISKNPKSIWVDADILCLSNDWDMYLKNKYIYAYEDNFGYANSILKIDDKIISRELLQDARQIKNSEIIWNEIGSDLINKYVKKYSLQKYAIDRSKIFVPGINVDMLFDPQETSIMLNKIESDNKIAIVFWNTYIKHVLGSEIDKLNVPKNSIIDYFFKMYWR